MTTAHLDGASCTCGLSGAAEDYLKGIYHLATREGAVTTSALAERMDVSAPSTSAMLRRLREGGLVSDTPDRSIELTGHGRRHALRIIRRHRLIESFLVEMLDVPWDEVHLEAERLEHAISDELEARIDRTLGHPTHDPHGDPIPPRDGGHDETWPDPLSEVKSGARFKVQRISDRDGQALQYLAGLGMRPGTVLEVGEREPFGGPLWVTVDGERKALGSPLTRLIHGDVLD